MPRTAETQGTGRKEDRRVRRTRKMLTQALTQLLQEKQVKDITVKELTELADMNRGTFYLYYKDIYDMLEKLEDTMFTSLDQILRTETGEEEGPHSVLPELFRFIEENREMCRLLLSPHGDMNFLHRMNSVVREKCIQYYREKGTLPNEEEFDYHYSFVIFGCAGLIRSWVNRNCKESPEDMAALTRRLIEGATMLDEKE